MSPIEHLSDILDRRVSLHVPPRNTIAQIQEALREEWEATPQQDIRHLVEDDSQHLAKGTVAPGPWPRTILIMLIKSHGVWIKRCNKCLEFFISILHMSLRLMFGESLQFGD